MDKYKTASIIIPAYNEEEHIKDCIESIKSLDYPTDKIEIIVVDNGSTDNTAKVAIKAGAKVINFPKGNVGAVRNRGVKDASGEILAFIDSDCVAGRNWLSAGVERLLDKNIGAVGGECRVPEGSGWVEKAWVGDQKPISKEVERLACSSLILTRELFDLLKGFNEQLSAAEDDDISFRIKERNLCLYSEEQCAVIHKDYPSSLFGIFSKQLWHGTNQIETSDGMFDKLLVATHLYLLALLTSLVTISFISFSNSYLTMFSGFLLLILIPAAMAYKRTSSNWIRNLDRYFKLNIIYTFYFLGRSIALLQNYYLLFFKSKKI